MPGALLALLGEKTVSPFPLNASWLQPEIVPAHWTAAARVAPTGRSGGAIEVRAGTDAEKASLPTLFPEGAWLAGDAIFVLHAADNETTIHAAAGLGSDGGLALGFAPSFPFAHDAAASLFEAVRAQARAVGVAEIFLRQPVASDSPLHRALERAGFETAGEQTLWLATVPAMLERARRLADRAGDEFKIRPLAAADLEPWRHRPEAKALLRPHASFDPDLSSAAFRDETPAGILVAQRIAGRAWVDVMCIANDARLAGCFVPMAIQALTAGIAAGTLEVVFVTGRDSRVASAFARRCGAKILQQGLRLRAHVRE